MRYSSLWTLWIIERSSSDIKETISEDFFKKERWDDLGFIIIDGGFDDNPIELDKEASDGRADREMDG